MSIVYTFNITKEGVTINLPLAGISFVTIDWGDGFTSTHTNNSNTFHTFLNSGIYNVSVSGSFTRFNVIDNTDPFYIYITKITYTSQISSLTSFSNAFSFILSDFDIDIGANVTSNVINMSRMFASSPNFNQPLSFDTSKVTDMSSMFSNASNFNQPLSFNTSNVTNMNNMFNGASKFNQPLYFDISSVTSMQNMLNSTSYSNDNYNNLLIHWAGQSNIQKNVRFGINNTTQYTNQNGKTARDTLINTNSWTITDGGDILITTLSAPTFSVTSGNKSTRKSNFFSMKSSTTDNSRIYYKPGSLSIGSNGVSNSRLKSRKT
jgi:surface protein